MVCGILERFSDNSRKDRLSIKKIEYCVCVCMYFYIHMPVSRHAVMVARVSQN